MTGVRGAAEGSWIGSGVAPVLATEAECFEWGSPAASVAIAFAAVVGAATAGAAATSRFATSVSSVHGVFGAGGCDDSGGAGRGICCGGGVKCGVKSRAQVRPCDGVVCRAVTGRGVLGGGRELGIGGGGVDSGGCNACGGGAAAAGTRGLDWVWDGEVVGGVRGATYLNAGGCNSRTGGDTGSASKAGRTACTCSCC